MSIGMGILVSVTYRYRCTGSSDYIRFPLAPNPFSYSLSLAQVMGIHMVRYSRKRAFTLLDPIHF